MRKMLIALAAVSLCLPLNAQKYEITWEKFQMNGTRAGVTIPGRDNVAEALGRVENGKYYAPNGKVYSGESAVNAAALLIGAQPAMSEVKEKVGYCSRDMKKDYPESELTNMIVDCMMNRVQETTGRKVDVGFLNFGGIRASFFKGDILVDDVVSMLPFKNYICFLEVKGSDLRKVYEKFSSKAEIVGGVELIYKNHKLSSVRIGGEPLDEDRTYGVATIDFLLDGGDNLSLARNAVEFIPTNVLLRDSLLPYLRKLASENKPVEYKKDGRVRYED